MKNNFLVLLICTAQIAFSMDIDQIQGPVQRPVHEISLASLESMEHQARFFVDESIKRGISVVIQFFDKGGKGLMVHNLGDVRGNLDVAVPQDATQFKVSGSMIHHSPRRSDMADSIEQIVFNNGQMINLNYGSTYVLKRLGDTYFVQAASVGRNLGKPGSLPRIPKTPAEELTQKTTPAQIIKALEQELLNKITNLAYRPHCLMHVVRSGSAQAKKDELEDQQEHISMLQQVIVQVGHMFESRIHCG